MIRNAPCVFLKGRLIYCDTSSRNHEHVHVLARTKLRSLLRTTNDQVCTSTHARARSGSRLGGPSQEPRSGQLTEARCEMVLNWIISRLLQRLRHHAVKQICFGPMNSAACCTAIPRSDGGLSIMRDARSGADHPGWGPRVQGSKSGARERLAQSPRPSWQEGTFGLDGTRVSAARLGFLRSVVRCWHECWQEPDGACSSILCLQRLEPTHRLLPATTSTAEGGQTPKPWTQKLRSLQVPELEYKAQGTKEAVAVACVFWAMGRRTDSRHVWAKATRSSYILPRSARSRSLSCRLPDPESPSGPNLWGGGNAKRKSEKRPRRGRKMS